MEIETIITFVDKTTFINKETGEGTSLCHVVLQEPVKRTDKNPFAYGTRSVDFYLKADYYPNFKKIYDLGSKIKVKFDFREVYDPKTRKYSYKRYIYAIDGKEL